MKVNDVYNTFVVSALTDGVHRVLRSNQCPLTDRHGAECPSSGADKRGGAGAGVYGSLLFFQYFGKYIGKTTYHDFIFIYHVVMINYHPFVIIRLQIYYCFWVKFLTRLTV